MKKILLLVLCCFIGTTINAQRKKRKNKDKVVVVNKEINIIYESKDELILNNGSKYEIIEDTPFYAVGDTSIKLTQTVKNEKYRLNRVLLIGSDGAEGTKQLIELINGKKLYYKVRKLNHLMDDTAISGSSY